MVFTTDNVIHFHIYQREDLSKAGISIFMTKNYMEVNMNNTFHFMVVLVTYHNLLMHVLGFKVLLQVLEQVTCDTSIK